MVSIGQVRGDGKLDDAQCFYPSVFGVPRFDSSSSRLVTVPTSRVVLTKRLGTRDASLRAQLVRRRYGLKGRSGTQSVRSGGSRLVTTCPLPGGALRSSGQYWVEMLRDEHSSLVPNRNGGTVYRAPDVPRARGATSSSGCRPVSAPLLSVVSLFDSTKRQQARTVARPRLVSPT